jgi:hypothetical protein
VKNHHEERRLPLVVGVLLLTGMTVRAVHLQINSHEAASFGTTDKSTTHNEPISGTIEL